MNQNRIVEKFGIHPTNFALARAMAGDPSDNLPGIGGVGLPTVSKRFPFLSENKTYTIDDVVSYASKAESKLKVYSSVVEKKELIEENYKIMQLYVPHISAQSAQRIRGMLKDLDLGFNKTAIQAMMITDGFGAYDWSDLFALYNKTMVENKNKK